MYSSVCDVIVCDTVVEFFAFLILYIQKSTIFVIFSFPTGCPRKMVTDLILEGSAKSLS